MLERVRKAMRYLGLMTAEYPRYSPHDALSLLQVIHAAMLKGDADLPDDLASQLDDWIALNPW